MKWHKSHGNNQNGFSLLEILISLSLLAFLSYYISQTTRGAVTNKAKIQGHLDQMALINNSMAVFKRDVSLAFNFIDTNVIVYNRSQELRIQRCEEKLRELRGGSSSDDKTKPDDKTASSSKKGNEDEIAALEDRCQGLRAGFEKKQHIPFSNFVGTKSSLHLTTLSYIRTPNERNVSQQAEVGYFIKSCRGRRERSEKTQCLWRSSTPYIDNNVDKGGRAQILITGVESFKLRYLLPPSAATNELQWIDNWYSDGRGDSESRGRFPAAVEVTIGVANQKGESTDKVVVLAPIRFDQTQGLSRKDVDR